MRRPSTRRTAWCRSSRSLSAARLPHPASTSRSGVSSAPAPKACLPRGRSVRARGALAAQGRAGDPCAPLRRARTARRCRRDSTSAVGRRRRTFRGRPRRTVRSRWGGIPGQALARRVSTGGGSGGVTSDRSWRAGLRKRPGPTWVQACGSGSRGASGSSLARHNAVYLLYFRSLYGI